MKRKSLLFLLLFALIAPWAANAQSLFTEDFENGTMPTGWTTSGDLTWTIGVGDYYTSTGAGHGDYNAKMSTSSGDEETGMLITPVIDLSSVTSAELSFMYVMRSWSGDTDELHVYYRTSSTGTWTQIEEYTDAASSWTTVEGLVLPNLSSTYQIAFEAVDLYGYGVGVDYINIVPGASCAKPTNLTANLVDGDGSKAILNWTENGSATQWQVCLDGDMTNLIPANTNVNFELTGLTAEVNHTAKVRAYCDANDQSDWSNEVTFKPTNAFHLTVNDGTNQNGYVPIYGLWVDNITQSQFIIPADDLADAANGTITQLTFYAAADKNWGAARFEVYMAEVAETTVSAMADWSTMEKVMNAASLGITNGVMVVDLDTPFDYTGGNLLIGFKQTVSGTWSSCSWYGVTATGASMGGYGTSINQQNFLPKTTIGYLPGEAPTCPKPRGLVAGTPAARSVVLNWIEPGDARDWQICLNGDESNLIPADTNEDFLLEGLSPETTYTIKVRSYCSAEDQSDWSNEVTILTDVTCPAPTDLTVSDITPFAANVAWSGTASSYNFAVQEPVFFYGFEDATPWVEDNFAPCTTYDGDGLTTYQITDWTPLGEYQFVGSMMTLQSGITDFASAHGGELFGGFVSGIPADGVEHNDDYLILPSITIENGYVFEFWASSLLSNWGLEHMRVGVYGGNGTITNYLAGSATDYVEVPNGWTKYSYDLSAFAGQSIQLAINSLCPDAYILGIDDIFVGYNYAIDENDIIPNATSPQALVLEPETAYQVLVQSACGGEDGESAWVYVVFTTPSNCVAPFNLSTTDVRAKSATLNWEGYQDGFQVRYRTVEHTSVAEGSFFEDFENNTSLTGWTVIRNGEGTQYTDWHVVNSETLFSSGAIPAHSGSYVVMGRSWNSYAYNVDNWLITPQVTLDGTLSYWVYDDGEYHENCDVYVSTTTADIDAFTLLADPESATNEWTERTVDLSSFNGQLGYIAFRLQDENKDFLFIDDVLIGSIETVPAGEWILGTTDALFFNTNDNPDYPLIPNTDYEWQVRGENRSCGDEGYTEWSVINTFHTPNECELPTDLYATGITANSVDSLTWTGVQQDFNLRYRTAGFDGYYLFEDFANDDDLLEGWYTVNFDSDYSGLYYEDETYTNIILQMVAALGTTDQYLLGPDMREEAAGNTLTFDYEAISGDDTENFEVGFVATDTVYWDTPVATSDTVWQTYTTVVPEGAVYMVLHYIDGYAILFDNFVCYNADDIVAAGEWIETLQGVNSPVAITGLDPETYYEWQVQGNSDGCTDGVTDWVSSEFKTLESEGQTIALVAGTNWFSTYFDIPLANLQHALNEALPSATSMTIKSKNSTSRWNGSQWRNANGFVWDVAKMYMIVVPEDCELVLNGTLINPAEHTITIEAGTPTWIGFPFSESKTFSEAIPAGFAVNGDQIKYQNATARFNGTNWRGSAGFTGLEPGKGYMYVPASNVTTDRTLDYSLGTSKAAKTSNLNFKKEAINMSLTPKTMSKAFNSKSNVQAEQKVTCKKAKKNEYCKSIKK